MIIAVTMDPIKIVETRKLTSATMTALKTFLVTVMVMWKLTASMTMMKAVKMDPINTVYNAITLRGKITRKVRLKVTTRTAMTMKVKAVKWCKQVDVKAI